METHQKVGGTSKEHNYHPKPQMDIEGKLRVILEVHLEIMLSYHYVLFVEI